MNIKAYSFEQNSHAFADVKRSIAERLTEPGIYFESFSDAKALFTDVSESIDDADLLLLAVESKAFLKFKPILIKAFNFTPAYSEKISKLMGDKVSDEKLSKAHTLVPDESTELLSEDGLYSGFYINDNGQYIVVFPLVENAYEKLLAQANFDFFVPEEDKTTVFDAIIDADTTSTKANSIIEKLAKYDFKLAIPTTPAAKILKADIKECIGFEEYIFFTPFVNDAGIDDPKQYAAQLAKSAMELRSAELGATISNIFREKKGDKIISYYAFVSVATADKVVVKKLFADPDETIDNLVIEATSELYSMIDKYIEEIAFKLNASADDVAKYEQSLIEAEVVSDIRPEATVSKKGAIAAIIALIVAVVLCVLLALRYSGLSPVDAPDNENLQVGDATPTIEIAQTTKPSTALYSSIPLADLESTSGSEFSPESSSSTIFTVSSIQNPNTPITQYPQNNTPTTTKPTTTEPTTTTTTEPPIVFEEDETPSDDPEDSGSEDSGNDENSGNNDSGSGAVG